MFQTTITTWRRPFAWAVLGMVLCGAVLLPAPANARVWIGFGFPLVVGPPAYYPPPVYYPPPAYYPPYGYPPPQAYYPPAPPYYPPASQFAPQSQYTPYQSGQSCNAGPSVCPMDRPTAPGSACYCTTAQGRVWGRAT
jgi:hypothetical protein